MPLPEDFNAWEHLRSQLTVAHNLSVERNFLGVEHDDISTPFGAMRMACFIQADDTVEMINLRLKLYYWIFRKDLPTPIYGLPAPDFQAEVTYRPQVILFFIEPYTQFLAAEKLNQATAEVSFRLIHETSQTINREKATVLAERIKEALGQGMGFSWMKGPHKYTYIDKTYQFRFKILAESELEAASVIRKVCQINNAPFNEELIRTHLDKNVYPVNPGVQEIYGITVKKPRKRPTTRVRFSRAELHISGIQEAISLVDLSRRRSPLVR